MSDETSDTEFDDIDDIDESTTSTTAPSWTTTSSTLWPQPSAR